MKIEEKKISKTQYCPQCFDKDGTITSVVIGEVPKTLYCPIHGLVGWEAQGVILEYVEKKVSIPDSPIVEEEPEKETSEVPEESTTEGPKEEELKESIEELAKEEDEEVAPEADPAEDTKK